MDKYDRYSEVKAVINNYLGVCKEEVILDENVFFFDKKLKFAFKLESIDTLRDFKVIPQYLPVYLCSLYILLNKKRYKKTIFPDLKFKPTFIDLGAAFNTRGVQIKLYNFIMNKVVCHTVNYVSNSYVQNEMYVYSKYSSLNSIPCLTEKIGLETYERDFIQGHTCTFVNHLSIKKIIYSFLGRNCNTNNNLSKFEMLVDDLITIYKSEKIEKILTQDFVMEKLYPIKSDIPDDLKSIISFFVKKIGNEVLVVKAHGDLAFRNIVFSDKTASLIDWERFSRFNVFYDVGNLIFNCTRDESLHVFNKTIDHQFVNTFVSKIEDALGVAIKDNFLSYYVLFLVDRLSYEKQLYAENILRYEKFRKIWTLHLRCIQQLLFENSNLI